MNIKDYTLPPEECLRFDHFIDDCEYFSDIFEEFYQEYLEAGLAIINMPLDNKEEVLKKLFHLDHMHKALLPFVNKINGAHILLNDFEQRKNGLFQALADKGIFNDNIE